MNLPRRAFLRMSGAIAVSAAAASISAPSFASIAGSGLGSLGGMKDELKKIKHRSLSLDCLNTGEKLNIDYWVDGVYVEDALAEINRLLRDHRTGDVHVIEPKLLDLLSGINEKMESKAAIEVISGYRSPATNAMLHDKSSGVAKRSLHMEGKAVDIRIGGKSLKDVHSAALVAKVGGVGFYPNSNFVHVDVGAVRTWQGS